MVATPFLLCQVGVDEDLCGGSVLVEGDCFGFECHLVGDVGSVVIVMVGCSFQFVGGVCLSGGTVTSINHGLENVKHKFAIF